MGPSLNCGNAGISAQPTTFFLIHKCAPARHLQQPLHFFSLAICALDKNALCLMVGELRERQCTMVLRIRKLIVVSVIAAVILLANVWVIAGWLDDVGLVAWARNLRSEYLTGSALAVIVVLLVLIPAAGVRTGYWLGTVSRCPVCDEGLRSGAKYCAACGSRV